MGGELCAGGGKFLEGGGGVGLESCMKTELQCLECGSGRIGFRYRVPVPRKFFICNGFGVEFSCLLVIFLLTPYYPLEKNREIVYKEKNSIRAFYCPPVLFAYLYGTVLDYVPIKIISGRPVLTKFFDGSFW